MAKPSLEGMMLSKPQPESGPAPKERASRKVVKLSPPPMTAVASAEIEKISLYLPKPAYRFIKQTALDHDRKAHDVLMEGIELVLARYGKTLADFQR
jgi:hypothetical protein